jgi:hypothetical protein
MRTATVPGPAWALALALTFGAAARGQDPTDEPPPPPEEAEAQGFPWLCFATSVAGLGGLFWLVRRRERELGLDQPGARRPETAWYCRACDRDVTGSECPRCRAPNPFIHEPVLRDDRRR